jgi:UDP-N-acetylmuramoylalanine--D-glutamate ligase
MGLGLHGGGLETAKFLARRGALLTVTDLNTGDKLEPSVSALNTFLETGNLHPAAYVLGQHRLADFENADIVVKNPIVRPDSPFLRAAKRVESDISLFLAENPARLTCVTGSKGKSTTASAIYYVLRTAYEGGRAHRVYLGGNITLSPLAFLDELTSGDDVILELSSWQLGDLRGKTNIAGGPLLKPKVAVLTSIFPDHQNWYGSMESYIADKKLIYAGQDKTDYTIALNDDWGKIFLAETPGAPLAATLPLPDLLPDKPLPQSTAANLALAALTAQILLSRPPHSPLPTPYSPPAHPLIKASLSRFPGLEHRMELFLEQDGLSFYNDSAATIPQAALAAVRALSPCILVAGGADKDLVPDDFLQAMRLAQKTILLPGSFTDKILKGIPATAAALAASSTRAADYAGPFPDLASAVEAALQAASTREKPVNIVLSPGCASFGMFSNEFDRGKRWKEAVRKAMENR